MAELRAAPDEKAGMAELAAYIAYLRAELLYEMDTREAEIKRLKTRIGE